MGRLLCFFLLTAALSAQSNPSHPSAVDLPQPSGPFAVGRVTYDWIDPARSEVLSKTSNTPREIMVDVWYPAAPPKPDARTAPYFPNADKIDQSRYANFEKHWWGTTWPSVVSGAIHTHVYENAPFVSGVARFPLIIFSPGYSVEPLGYTHQIQELVSFGYVVATIHHTYEAAVTRFPDGRMIPFSIENGRGQDSPTIEEYGRWEKSRVDVWAADIRFTLDQVARLNAASAPNAPFAGRIDTHEVGAFGHSFGGLAAARACGLDSRIMACINQDGIGLDGSIPHYGEGHMPVHPYLYLAALMPPPTNKDDIERRAQIDKELEDCHGDAYQVSIGTAGFDHMGFADFTLLQAAGNPADAAKAARSLQLVESYTRAFFDKFLKQSRETLLDREPATHSQVVVKTVHDKSLRRRGQH